ncbi:hypothetical protein Poly30_43000 [Planctomycetes bacterium Poly30]|uniref:Archaeal glycosylation protein B peripheral domain-containing protein n=1 Tax=Saltatorellus ferox TaxID=2528018 RepID=A0A518EXC1_9BACT|nr:hypothetical protein Poly30_43000 [Planctomycetes bacterium Poly30]
MSSAEGERRASFQAVGRVLLVLLVGLFAYWIRVENAVGFSRSVEGSVASEDWGSYDPDTLYHARRVARGVRDHGWIESYDPLLAHGAEFDRSAPGGDGGDPRELRTYVDPALGVPIPWPPFYDLLLTAVYRRSIPSPDALMHPKEHPPEPPLGQPEKNRIERFVASVPSVLGALTAMLVALIAAGRARRLSGQRSLEAGRDPSGPSLGAAGLAAAAFAGVSLALTYGHVRYSHLGNGDHHAFISLLHVAMLGLTARAFDHERIVQPFWSAARGTGAGLFAAAMITSWTASILWVALVQLAMVIRLLVPFRAADGRRFSARGLPIFATSFHKAALLGVVPCVIESPFSDLAPWSLVELSWLHLAWLSAGWLVFAPYALMPQTAVKNRLVALGPAFLLSAAVLALTPVGHSLTGAFSWASASNSFMSSINESRPLVPGDGLAPILKYCGVGVLVAPVVWFGWLFAVRHQPSLLPFVFTLPFCAVAALLQRRFAESLAGPLSICLGIGFGSMVGAWVARGAAGASWLRRGGVAVLVAALLGAALHPWTIRNTWLYRANAAAGGFAFPNTLRVSKAEAALAAFLENQCAQLGSNADSAVPRPEAPRPGVLAHWDLGHSIEWRAGLATVATNFGLYVGEDAFLDPWRFFTETDPEAAEEILVRRGVEYVLIDGDRNRAAMAAALDVPIMTDPAYWRETMAARLLRDGSGLAPLPAPGFLSLVAAASNGAWGTIELYRRVEGAYLEAVGARSLQVVATLQGEDGTQVRWQASATAVPGQVGPLTLRVPYASPDSLVEASPVLSLEVFIDGSRAVVSIPPAAVETGRTVLVH